MTDTKKKVATKKPTKKAANTKTANKVGKPLAFKTVKELEGKVDSFFTSDEAFIIDFKEGEEVRTYAPTVAGLALHLGVDRKTIVNYSNKEEYFPTIKKARARIEAHLEKKLFGNNVTGLIFNLKNNFDWKDKTEVAQTNIEMSHEDWLNSLD